MDKILRVVDLLLALYLYAIIMQTAISCESFYSRGL